MSAVTPNVLVMMDNSGTMALLAYCFSSTGANVTNNATPYTACESNPVHYVDGTGAPVSNPLPTGGPFVETVTFGGRNAVVGGATSGLGRASA